MKVLVVTGGFPLASETFVRAQCSGLMAAGCDVEVLALRPGDGSDFDEQERSLGLPARVRAASLDRPLAARLLRAPLRAGRIGLQSPAAAWKSVSPWSGWRASSGRLLEAFAALGDGAIPRRYDIVHAQFGPSGIVASELRRAGLITGRLSVAFYGYDITREPRLRGSAMYERMFEDAEWILPNSAYLAGLLREAGAPAEKVSVHRLGIDNDRFPFCDRSGRDESGPWRVVAVGRMVEKKGFEFLIRAIARLGDLPNLKATIVGDGPLRPELARLAEDLAVGDRIELPGWLDHAEVGAVLSGADCFAAPSVVAADGDMEGLPLVVVEAMATGLPVVGTRHSGIPEAVRPEVNGLLVEERDVEGLAEALRRLASPLTRLKWGRESRAIAERDFSHPRLIDQLLKRWSVV